MEELFSYLTDPNNIVSFIVFIFWLWATWSSLNWRLKDCEKKLERIDEADIEARLAEIKTDLQRIKTELQKISK
jgi:hypothetical protein